ncbi:MAG: hypothetical protein HAW66_07525 [Shewanella sp.]|nr:hypothetical protein [Shewanella sp.]
MASSTTSTSLPIQILELFKEKMSSDAAFNNDRVIIGERTYRITALLTQDKLDAFVGLSCNNCKKLLTFFSNGVHHCLTPNAKKNSDHETIFKLQELIDFKNKKTSGSIKQRVLSTFLESQNNQQLQRAILSPKSEQHQKTRADLLDKGHLKLTRVCELSTIISPQVDIYSQETSVERAVSPEKPLPAHRKLERTSQNLHIPAYNKISELSLFDRLFISPNPLQTEPAMSKPYRTS